MNQRQMRFDAAGNLTHDAYTGAGTRVYDAENRMTSAGIAGAPPATYAYDGDGRRVKRTGGTSETWQVYGIGGELLAEYAANAAPSNPQKEYGYRNGELLITATLTVSSGGSAFSFADDPLVVGTTSVKAAHVNELRTAIDQARVHAELSAANWAESITAGVTTIKASHVTELRTRLDEARTALGLSTGGYTDSALANGYDIRAVHISELRSKTNEALTAGGGTSLDVRWLVSDQLGTPRMIFDQTGSLANVSRHDYLPFGEELGVSVGGRTAQQGYGVGDGVRQRFTLKERDTETGLDYFLARYFSSSQGRFTGVDPAPIKKKHLINPQDLNRYSYVANNPLAFIDPDGEEKITVIVRTFIPSQTVGSKPAAVFKGDYNAKGERISTRTEQRITIETDSRRAGGNGIVDYSQTVGRTVRVARGLGSLTGPSEGQAKGDTLQKGFERINDNSVRVTASGNESNPLITGLSGSPAITYNLAVTVSSEGENGRATVNLYGQHDGFPAYEVEIQRPESGGTSTIIYQHDPNKTGDGAASLYGSGEYYPRTQNIVIEPRKKKKDERE